MTTDKIVKAKARIDAIEDVLSFISRQINSVVYDMDCYSDTTNEWYIADEAKKSIYEKIYADIEKLL